MARRYVHSDNVDDPVVQYDGSAIGAAARIFLMPDERGSIVGLVNNGGTSLARNSYDEYGIPGSANQGRFQYTGQAWIPELGMYHYKARIYSPTLGRFLQVDPIGYEDQYNLYAYVGNDPVNKTDPKGTTCTSTQQGDRTVYSCRIDSVAILDKNGNSTGRRPPSDAENKRFASFNKKYTDAVNKLMSNPNRNVTVSPVKGGLGSFQTTAGKAGEALISREFIYAPKSNGDQAMMTAGGPGVDGKAARSFVRPLGLREGKVGIVHEGGLHGTPEEFTGGLQGPTNPLSKLDAEHQGPYNEAACSLLGGGNNC